MRARVLRCLERASQAVSTAQGETAHALTELAATQEHKRALITQSDAIKAELAAADKRAVNLNSRYFGAADDRVRQSVRQSVS